MIGLNFFLDAEVWILFSFHDLMVNFSKIKHPRSEIISIFWKETEIDKIFFNTLLRMIFSLEVQP